MADARADECDLLRVALGRPLADSANQLCAAQDRVPLVSAISRWWRIRGHQPSAPHDREGVGWEASVLDSQNVKTSAVGDPRGYEASKQVKDHWQSLPTYPSVRLLHSN
jgi:hypothetical protein